MKRSKKSASESAVENSNLVLPSHANALGTIFGGTIMSWIDVTAAICAQRHSGSICVTASVDTLNFLSPVKVGDAVTLKARVVYTGRTSMMIFVDVSAQRVGESGCRKCVDAYLTFVAIDQSGNPKEVPELLVSTDAEKKEYETALERRRQILAQKSL